MRIPSKHILALSVFAACAFTAASHANAATITTWTNGDFTNNSVLTLVSGTVKYADDTAQGTNNGNTYTTANGVFFSRNDANVTYSNTENYNAFFSSPRTSGDAAFDTVLKTARYGGLSAPRPDGYNTITLKNLVIGQSYQALFLAIDNRNQGTRNMQVGDDAGNRSANQQYSFNDGSIAGSSAIRGGYVTGTFTADATTQIIRNYGFEGLMAAVVLYELAPTGNNSQILISSSPTSSDSATGASSKTINLGNTFVGVGGTTASQTIAQSGSDPTTYSVVNLTGDVSSTSFAGGNPAVNNSGTITLNVATSGSKSGTASIDNLAADSLSAGKGSADANDTFTVTANVFQTASLSTGVVGANLNLTNAASTDGGQRAGVTVSSLSLANAAVDNRRASNFTVSGGGSVGDATNANVTSTVGTYALKTDRLNNSLTSYHAVVNVGAGSDYTDPTLAGLANPTFASWDVSTAVTGVASTPNRTGGVNDFGSVRQADIAGGDTLAGYYSFTAPASLNSPLSGDRKVFGTTAQIQAGTASGDLTLEMSWRAPMDAANGAEKETYVAGPTHFTNNNAGLFSDIVRITGLDNQLFVLTLSYDPANLVAASPEASLILGWLNGDGKWTNAVNGNHGPQTIRNMGDTTWLNGLEGGLDASDLGKYGVYTNNDGGNYVWAVLNHNSDFAVIPEPASLALFALSTLPLLTRRRRQK